MVVYALLIVVGTIMRVPVVVVLISWLTLIGVLAVEEGLNENKSNDTPERT